jgi:putative peptidoglycan lipid II flippase
VRLLRNASVMGVAVLLSRFLGLIREQVTSFLFGAGLHSDAYFVAFRIPNLFRDLFAEGALSAAFISVFSKIKDPKERAVLAHNMGLVLIWILLFVCFFIVLFAPQIISVLSEEFTQNPEKFSLTVDLTRVLTPFLLFVSLAALSMGILNSLGRYFIPALGSAAFNLVSIIIGGGLAFWQIHHSNDLKSAIVAFAIGTLIGGFFQWFIQWPSLKKEKISRDLGFRDFFLFKGLKNAWSDPRIKRVFKIMAPSILSVGAMQVNVMINTFFASGLQEGSVSWLYYSFRLVHFPMGIFGVSLFMATLPQLARLTDNKDEFEKTFSQAVRYSLILSIVSTLGLWVLAEPITSLIFERGRFLREDTLQTAAALKFYALGLLGFGLHKILISVFYAFEKIWIPSLVGLISVVSNFLMSWFFSQHFGHYGIALSVSLSSTLSVLILACFIKKQGFAIWSPQNTKALLGIALASLVFAIFNYFDFASLLMSTRTSLVLFLGLLMATIAFLGLAYLFIVSLFIDEGRIILRKITNIVLRIKK